MLADLTGSREIYHDELDAHNQCTIADSNRISSFLPCLFRAAGVESQRSVMAGWQGARSSIVSITPSHAQ